MCGMSCCFCCVNAFYHFIKNVICQFLIHRKGFCLIHIHNISLCERVFKINIYMYRP